MSSVPILRKATTADVLGIHTLVNQYARQGLMLHRSLSELYENVRDFFIIEVQGEVVACAALHVSWKGLAELKSLAVASDHQRRGLGKRLVKSCLEEANKLGVERVFALTYVPELFEKLGFVRVDKAGLPRKVWTECIHCPHFVDCREVAVVYDLRQKPT